MSTDPKTTKRRDPDPVRVYADGRIWYWTGGRPGVGTRVPERRPTKELAEIRATELRLLLARTQGLGAKASSDLDQVMQDMLADMRASGDAEGSIRQYKSNWNAWIPKSIGDVRCLDVDIMNRPGSDGGS